MLSMNSSMSKVYGSVRSEVELESGLRSIADSGFKEKCGCFVFGKFLDIETNAEVGEFQDRTGYECFINSINIDDYVDEGMLEQGIAFVKRVFLQWSRLHSGLVLAAIMIFDELGLKTKFHVLRDGERWLSDDLEGYEESILVVDSSEPGF
mgnify:CR=1 FL=1